MLCLILHLLCLTSLAIQGNALSEKYISGNNTDIVEAYNFLDENDKVMLETCRLVGEAEWNYNTNLTEENKAKVLEAQRISAKVEIETFKNATSFAWKTFKDDDVIYRWFKSLSVLGQAALPEEKYSKLTELIADMESTYSTAQACGYKSKTCNLSLEPELSGIMESSRNYAELEHTWKVWRDASGKKFRDEFLQYANLSNEAALLNGFSDTGELWREIYEDENFESSLEELWNTLKPFYQNLHAYVRRKLRIKYGCRVRRDGPIPANILGGMWGQEWENIYDIVEPFHGKSDTDVTKIMLKKGMTTLQMFKMAEEFFTSLGLLPMSPEFWGKSVFEKPKDRNIVCHASAWDMCDGKDVRIKMCAKVNMQDLITVHHEMGHLEYFLQYGRQPYVFRNGANPGFHEAIGDVLALSVSTPKHLKAIGLLDEISEDEEADINFLMKTALKKVAFLPFGYLIDLWRWRVFNGDIKPEEMNSKWWELRFKYQGLCPPVRRTEEDFDPGAKYHVISDTPYVRYFVSYIVQFQFHKALCDAALHSGPLHKCDIYRSKKAGEVLSMVLAQGSSIHWGEAMSIITGGETNKMDVGPLMEYFSPLIKWLEKENKKEIVGWKTDDIMLCP